MDRSVAQEVIDRLQPLGIEAALAAMNDHGKEQLGPVDKLALAPVQPERLGRCNTDVATWMTR